MSNDSSSITFSPMESSTQDLVQRDGPISAWDQFQQLRHQIEHILHLRKVEILIIVFVVLDALVVLAELLVDLGEFGEDVDHHVSDALHYVSITILSFFVVEVILKIFAMDIRYFKNPMTVVDGVIVIISFILDLVFHHNTHLHNILGLVILLRLWRIVRIINSAIMSIRADHEAKMEKKRKEIETLQNRLKELEEKVVSLGGVVDDSSVQISNNSQSYD